MKDSQNTNTGTTIEEYLRGRVGFEVTDSAISAILIDRGIAPGNGCHYVGEAPEGFVPGRPLYVVRNNSECNRKRRGCQRRLETQGRWYANLRQRQIPIPKRC